MKIVTVLGTRPEIIRLSRIIPRLDGLCEHVLAHTGQNYDPALSDIFFEAFGLRRPDVHLGVRGRSFGEQAGAILAGVEEILVRERPDRLLVLGDTNSGLAAIAAKRLGVRVLHMEAGNRCRDDRVPEEVNRRVIDHSSDALLPYTNRGRDNLLREGVEPERIFVTGNPIYEVILRHERDIAESGVLDRLGLRPKSFFLATLHRQENVDVKSRLAGFVTALNRLAAESGLPVVVSVHPRTRSRMDAYGVAADNVRFLPPFGFFDFLALEKAATCVLSDSGTVQEECCILKTPNVTLRDVTERPETIECGSGMLTGGDPDAILSCVQAVTAMGGDWTPPWEYLVENVSATVARIALGFQRCPDRREPGAAVSSDKEGPGGGGAGKGGEFR